MAMSVVPLGSALGPEIKGRGRAGATVRDLGAARDRLRAFLASRRSYRQGQLVLDPHAQGLPPRGAAPDAQADDRGRGDEILIPTTRLPAGVPHASTTHATSSPSARYAPRPGKRHECACIHAYAVVFSGLPGAFFEGRLCGRFFERMAGPCRLAREAETLQEAPARPVEAWASLKSFRAKNGYDERPGPGRNGERDFHGEKRATTGTKARPISMPSFSAKARRTWPSSTSWCMRCSKTGTVWSYMLTRRWRRGRPNGKPRWR
jgi:hypothetical protein